MSLGIRRTPIRDLAHGSKDFLLVAVIIAKQAPKIIKVKSSSGVERCVWNFTVRDSPPDYINVSYWGTPEYIENIAQHFHIDNVVDIIKATAAFRKNDSSFLPDVTCPLQLTMNKNVSEMCLHSAHDCLEFIRLLRLPTKPPSDYLTISDVLNNGQALRGKEVNMLVAVKSLGVLRQVTTKKDGKQLDSREVEVMDQSPTPFYLQLWDGVMTYRANNWKPRETVLFVADLRLGWNDYKKTVTGTVTARTVVTEDPCFPDADQLREYARTAPTQPSAILQQLATHFPDPATINTVMSCQAVWDRTVNSESAESFTALVFAAIFELDLDGLKPQTVSRCKSCQLMVDDAVGLCMNPECPVSSGLECPTVERVFDLRITLADHTGSLPNCHITSAAAVQALHCSPEEFDMMSLDDKTTLKWQLLLKKAASRVAVLPTTRDRQAPLISILSIDRVSLPEYAARLPMY